MGDAIAARRYVFACENRCCLPPLCPRSRTIFLRALELDPSFAYRDVRFSAFTLLRRHPLRVRAHAAFSVGIPGGNSRNGIREPLEHGKCMAEGTLHDPLRPALCLIWPSASTTHLEISAAPGNRVPAAVEKYPSQSASSLNRRDLHDFSTRLSGPTLVADEYRAAPHPLPAPPTATAYPISLFAPPRCIRQ